VRDLTDSLTEGLVAHVSELSRRLPGARLILQVDEPALPAVLAGRVPTASGYATVAAIEPVTAERGLAAVLAAAGVPTVLHCCAVDPPLDMLRNADPTAVSFDLLAGTPDRDALGRLVDAGVQLYLGAVPALGPGAPPQVRSVAEPIRRLWHELGFPPERLPDQVVVTPSCGLAGASEGWARTALRLVRQTAQALADAPEPVTR
jgi:methionine synthase II (cobalamin-independent)